MSFMINLDVMADQLDINRGHNGKIKAVNGVNGVPVPIAPGFPELQKQFNEMLITDIRLHDTFGPLDIDNYYPTSRTAEQLMPNVPEVEQETAAKLMADLGNFRVIFPNAALGMRQGDLDLALKDANWEIADSYLRNIINNDEHNSESVQRNVIFRIGRSVDGGFMMPENIDIYAALVAKVVDRYGNKFSAVGLKRKIVYWEIWNEPNLGFFWNETFDEYCIFYGKLARAIKAVDPDAKVGGPSVLIISTVSDTNLERLLAYCHDNKLPLDFLSWHLYRLPDPDTFITIGDYVRGILSLYGFAKIESIVSEWNTSPVPNINTFTKTQSAVNASYIASTLIKMQSTSIDRAHYYRADGASFGLFNRSYNPKKPDQLAYCTYSAQAFKLFSKMLETPNILRCSHIEATGLSILSARNDYKINILVANYKIDSDLYDPEKKPRHGFYEQYHVNSSKSISELNDEISRKVWFGGKNPTSLYSNNSVTEIPVGTKGHIYIGETYKYYSDSKNGLKINLYNLENKIKKLTVYRIYESGDLSDLLPEEVDATEMIRQTEQSITITDDNAAEYTVTLYSIDI
jgi:xylan 1,4-beta-xylosidase